MRSQHNNREAPTAGLALAVVLVLGVGILWAYWPALVRTASRWQRDPQYSHGFLVPGFALVLLWLRRERLAEVELTFSWWGVVLLLVAAAVYLAGGHFFIPWLDGASLLLCLAGLAVLAGKGQALRWAGPSIAFLAFMLPLPYRVQAALGQPLQRIATLASTYTLQTLGLPAMAEGNVILLGNMRIGVVEACNGLGMLVLFFAVSTAVALLSRRPACEKAVLVASAVPIAVFANIVRIVATALLNEFAGGGVADAVYHDWSGWLMMPLALALLGAEMLLLGHLLVERKAGRRIAFV